jgi:Flp pilus assembly protein TadD
MRKLLIIVVVCLLIGQGACSRKKPAAGAETDTTAGASTAESGLQAREALEKGKEFYRNDQDEKAVEAFQLAIKLDPQLAEAHFRLGLALDALGKEAEAQDSYKKSIESYKKYFGEEANEKDAEAHYNLAQTYAGLHLYTEAVREYRQATRLKEDDADIYYDLGMALSRLAQYDEAATAFSKSLELDPENFRAQDGLDEAREGMKRIRAGKKHQEDLLKKQKADEMKEEQDGSNPGSGVKPADPKKP